MVIGLLFVLSTTTLQAQKTDNIWLENGNKVTGEIKKLEYGKLTFNTNDLGLLNVNWEKVVNIESNKVFEIETTQGYLFRGKLEDLADTGAVLVRTGAAGTEIDLRDITTIYPIKSRFIKRISGPVNLSIGYSKANDLLQLGFDTDLGYRGTKIYSSFSSSSAYTSQYDSIKTQRQKYSFSAGKNFRKHWYTGGLVGYEQNSELGIQSRVNLGAQVGRTFIQNNKNNLETALAVQGTREYFYSSKPSVYNLELFLNIKYKHFLYYTPKSDITTELQFLPNMTDWGRVRINYSIMVKQELFSDFFWSLSFYINYDNRPPDANSATTDWSVTTGFGYSF
jgi:hypothetical protein